jgi:hypothetical protein
MAARHGAGNTRRAARSQQGTRLQVAPPLLGFGVAQADRYVHEHETDRITPYDVGDGGRNQIRMGARFVERDGDPPRAAAVHADEIHGPEV